MTLTIIRGYTYLILDLSKLMPDTFLSGVCILSHFVLTTTLQCMRCYYSRCANVEIEAKSTSVTRPRSRNQKWQSPQHITNKKLRAWNSGLSDAQVHIYNIYATWLLSYSVWVCCAFFFFLTCPLPSALIHKMVAIQRKPMVSPEDHSSLLRAHLRDRTPQ